MTGIYVVIPYKGPDETKTRLGIESGGFLNSQERRQVSEALLRDLYDVWRETVVDGGLGQVVVGIKGPRSSKLVAQYNERGINAVEMPFDNINRSLYHLADKAGEERYDSFGVSGADLMLITGGDVNCLLTASKHLSRSHPESIVFSVGHRLGTTAYVARPPRVYKTVELYRKGTTNFGNQISRLSGRGIPFAVIKNMLGLRHDIDYPDDLVEAHLLMKHFSEAGVHDYRGRRSYELLDVLMPDILSREDESSERLKKILSRYYY